MFASRYVPLSFPLFSYKLADDIYFLDYKTFTRLLSTMLLKAGVDRTLYSGHSLRRGGATYAFQCGVPPAYIKLQGD